MEKPHWSLDFLLLLHLGVFIFLLSVSAFQILILEGFFYGLINFCDNGGKFLKAAYNFFLFLSIPNIIFLAIYYRFSGDNDKDWIPFFILATLINSAIFLYSSRIINTWYISERRVEIVEVKGKKKVRIPRVTSRYYLFISPTNLYPCGKISVKPELYRNVKEGDKVKITLGKGLFGVWVVLYTTTPSL
jgi:hypothetical protein